MTQHQLSRFEAVLGRVIRPAKGPPDLPDLGGHGHLWATCCLITGASLSAMVEGVSSTVIVALMFALAMAAPWVAYWRQRLRGRRAVGAREIAPRVQRAALLAAHRSMTMVLAVALFVVGLAGVTILSATEDGEPAPVLVLLALFVVPCAWAANGLRRRVHDYDELSQA